MLDDTIINQLENLKGNITWMDKDEIVELLKKAPQSDKMLLQHYIHCLNDFLVDGKINS